MGEIHELFVLALSLVWFAGATPDLSESCRKRSKFVLTPFFGRFLAFSDVATFRWPFFFAVHWSKNPSGFLSKDFLFDPGRGWKNDPDAQWLELALAEWPAFLQLHLQMLEARVAWLIAVTHVVSLRILLLCLLSGKPLRLLSSNLPGDLNFGLENWRGFWVNVPFPRNKAVGEKSSKTQENRKDRGTFFLQLFWTNVLRTLSPGEPNIFFCWAMLDTLCNSGGLHRRGPGTPGTPDAGRRGRCNITENVWPPPCLYMYLVSASTAQGKWPTIGDQPLLFSQRERTR